MPRPLRRRERRRVDAPDAARAWLAQDPDGETRAELREIIAAAEAGDDAAPADLADRFGGAAGLRHGGPARRARRRQQPHEPRARGPGGRRARGLPPREGVGGCRAPAPPSRPPSSSATTAAATRSVFAQDSAELFAGAGLRAILLPRLLPTPVLAFAVRHLGAAAGVMVTASHNPPNDNGYKVYLGGADEGSQIVPPADAEIAAHIQRIADDGDIAALPRSLGYETAGESLVDAYIDATAAVAPAPEGADGLRWVYTAMHGVGLGDAVAHPRGRRLSRARSR